VALEAAERTVSAASGFSGRRVTRPRAQHAKVCKIQKKYTGNVKLCALIKKFKVFFCFEKTRMNFIRKGNGRIPRCDFKSVRKKNNSAIGSSFTKLSVERSEQLAVLLAPSVLVVDSARIRARKTSLDFLGSGQLCTRLLHSPQARAAVAAAGTAPTRASAAWLLLLFGHWMAVLSQLSRLQKGPFP